ncbi:MAG: preprotein translocase subunit YajC [Pseudonocardia sp.]|nr:preprotein translocase subunit YajC [Pseudonocardia sp.]
MDLSLLLPLFLLVLFIPIFLSSRKQRKQVAEMQRMQAALEEGDIVVTTSGLRGVVVDVGYEETVDLEIADDVVTTWVRAAIREKVVGDTPDGAGAHAPADGAVVDAPPSLTKSPTDTDANGASRS